MSEEIETFNKYMVSMSGRGIALQMPPHGHMTDDEAVLLAAWLLALADPVGEKLPAVLEAIQNS